MYNADTDTKVATSELIAIHYTWRKRVTYLFHEEIKEKCKVLMIDAT